MNNPISLKPGWQGIYAISGVPNESGKTFLISQISSPQILTEGILWFTRDINEAKKISALLNFWLQPKLKTPVIIPEEANRPLVLQSLNTDKPNIIIFPLDFFNQPVVALETLKQKTLLLKPNQRYTPAELSQQLILTGYEYNTTADVPGSFSRRGNIVDIFPQDLSHPLRLEFNQTTIDQLMEFQEFTGKNIRSLDQALIIPARLDHYEASGRWNDYFKSISHRWIVYSDPDELESISAQWSEIQRVVKKLPQIVFYSLPNPEINNEFDFKNAPLYHRDFTNCFAHLNDWRVSGFKIIFPDSIKNEVMGFWEKNYPDEKLRVDFLPASYLDSQIEGFVWPQGKTVFLTDLELIGHREIKRLPKKRRADLTFISELKPGDYVVHLDHGVGRFRGLVTNMVDGITKEYFQLEYAAKDKLSVPVELAYKIDKYIGSETPKIHRLSNTSWQQLTRRIKEEAKKIATKLVKLYAQRITARVEPFQSTTPEEIELNQSFAYAETPDQIKAIQDVTSDLEHDEPMDRLICGDVGFGKTEVAIRAAFKAAANGKQVAVLAPTTILAQQHYDTFIGRLKKFPVVIDSLSRYKSRSQQKETVAKIKTGEIDIIIGTHRLLSSDVVFKNLGLIIIDEEQRFGVRHKEKLQSLRTNVHVLTLTATPIPRTLNLSLSSIRDMSVIRTPPEGRQPIETIIQPQNEATIKQAIKYEISRGGQIYFLHNRVETINLKANQIKQLVPEVKIGVIHGQLPESQLAHTMSEFDNQTINLLVSTTIIENGLDLPNVNTLIVEDATRFGLAQLYQIRGRIGRGHRQAYAYFFYPQKKLTGEAKKRLQAILEAKELGSGFQLALRDLEIRGVGNILGREQHGRVNTIGLSLYSRLLSQAVEELKTGKPTKQLRDISIDLPLPITIPTDYISQESQRLKVYRELSDVVEIDELTEKFKALEKQYGSPPINLKNLERLLRLKLRAQDTGIESLDTIHVTEGNIVKPRLIIKFFSQYTPDQIKKLLDLNSNWVLGERLIKIDFEHLNKKWLVEIEKVVEVFQYTQNSSSRENSKN